MRKILVGGLLLLAAISAATSGAALAQRSGDALPLDSAAIAYRSAPLDDPATKLSRKIEQGKLRLAYDPVTGYLPALLKALDIPVESQMAVFSKTSVQGLRIEPSNPRVLFFNDSVIVGWVRGGSIEIASQDPVRGMIFYLLDQSAQPTFVRHQDCLRCHMTPATLAVPGTRVRSVFPSNSGVPVDSAPQYDTDSRTPFSRLWGGWYVTGDNGPARHMGNRVVSDPAHPEAMIEGLSASLDSLSGKTLPGTTLTPYSDIAALLVFEHQTRVMNLLTRAGWASRTSLAETHSLNAAAKVDLQELADGLLFVGDAPLPGGISGASGFAQAFAARGPRDAQGRSLRTLSLDGRLMRYGCSYMIYSPAFDALPVEAKDVIYRRMEQRLAAEAPPDRAAILRILRDTKPGLPDYLR